MEYSNFRKNVTIADWPYGRGLKTECAFTIEKTKRGERAIRVTVNPATGIKNKPKALTYCMQVMFAQGSDMKTYIIQKVGWAYSVMQANMKYQEEVIGENDPRFEDIAQIFLNAQTTPIAST